MLQHRLGGLEGNEDYSQDGPNNQKLAQAGRKNQSTKGRGAGKRKSSNLALDQEPVPALNLDSKIQDGSYVTPLCNPMLANAMKPQTNVVVLKVQDQKTSEGRAPAAASIAKSTGKKPKRKAGTKSSSQLPQSAD